MNPFHVLTRGVRFDKRKSKENAKNKASFPEAENNKKEEQSNNVEESEPEVDKDLKSLSVEDFREKYNIIVDGEDLKAPVSNFNDLKIDQLLKKNLENGGFDKPTPIQMQAIPLMLEQRCQIIGSAPTGSGKTLAFLLPMIHHLYTSKSNTKTDDEKDSNQNIGFRAIVVAPTRELAKQIHRECIFLAEGTGLRVDLIRNTGLATKKFNAEADGKFDILITTPQRLEFLLKQEPIGINIQNLEWLIIDECDRLFEKTFRDQLSMIFNVCNQSKLAVRHAMFSATYDPNLEQWCRLHLDSLVTLIIGGKNRVAESVDQKLQFVGGEAGKLFALKDLIAQGCPAPVLIFVSTIKKADYLQRELSSMKLSVDCVHADRSQEYRDKIVRQFRSGKLPFLICTELMGRGIDFKAVNLVVNYDFPSSAKAYIHHIGRTGRAGRKGLAVTFYSQRDEERLIPVIRIMNSVGCEVPKHLQGLNKRKIHELTRLRKVLKNQREKRRRIAAKRKLEDGDGEESFGGNVNTGNASEEDFDDED